MNTLRDLISQYEADILAEWIKHQEEFTGTANDLLKESEREDQSRRILASIRDGLASGETNIKAAEWRSTLDVLGSVSRERALAGFTTSQTASTIFSLKQPLFSLLQRTFGNDPAALAQELWSTTTLIDALGLHTIESFQKTREDVIQRQQMDMLELSTPVVQLFEGLLALPLIGTLDSARTQVVMENLLNSIVEQGATIAILDITGVPTVDTQVAQHLLKTIAAARLMGADCIISGVRPQIAQTIVHLGLDLSNVTTKATMADALQVALKRIGYRVVRTEQGQG